MMILHKHRTLVSLFTLVMVLTSVPALAKRDKKDKDKDKPSVLDSGTFVVMVNDKKVATERFDITQSPTMSLVKSELKVEEGGKETEKSEMQLAPNGDLLRYTCTETGKGQAVVEPQQEFLVEKVSRVDAKTAEQPFILPASTSIMDDGFFSHREVLLWRYLAMQCHRKPGELGCPLEPLQFGVIVPRQQSSMQVTVQFVGLEDVSINGVAQKLSRFDLHSEAGDWNLWIDQAYKVQKIDIPAEHTEIVRE